MERKTKDRDKTKEQIYRRASDAVREDVHAEDTGPRNTKEDNPVPPFDEDINDRDLEPTENREVF